MLPTTDRGGKWEARAPWALFGNRSVSTRDQFFGHRRPDRLVVIIYYMPIDNIILTIYI